jgi:threonylcarbamoyladenosine tRNA methylthiotransferase MtaB
MKTFSIITLGCKVNQYESRQIRELIASLGLKPTDTDQSADIVIVNTCCVTHTASAKSRQAIRKAQKLNPNTTVVITGCLPAGPTDELKNLAGDIHIVSQKSDLPTTLQRLTTTRIRETEPMSSNKPSFATKIKDKNAESKYGEFSCLPPLKSFSGQTRAFLKIQDGCDGYCTYCIIPQIRTNVCNKNVKTVLTEAYDLAQAGHKEIVLTGIFLGAYGQNTARRKKWDPDKLDSLADLLDKIAQTPGLERVRLSSLEPADVTDRLIEVFCKHDNIAPHLHLPLQSGSPGILKKMCRQYKIEDFHKSIQKLQQNLDRPAITTDIIVGFPGETEEDFEMSKQIMQQVKFAKSHIFPFSPRKGTPAAKMHPTVDNKVIKERSKILRDLDQKLQKDFKNQFKGENVKVIIESKTPTQGRCERYFIVKLKNKKATPGQLINYTLP